jgi:uncharacterized protein
MRRCAQYRGFAAAAVCFALAGCSLLPSPRPETSKFFVLTAKQDAAPLTASGGSGLAIGVGPVRLPDYLDRTEIATRVAPNRIQYSDSDRWGGLLDESFRRVLAADLARSLGNPEIVQFPRFRPTGLDYRIEVDVQRFERDVNGSADLVARFTVRDGRSGKVLAANDSTISRPASGGTDASVAALSANIAELSDQIASAVRDLESQRARKDQ